ncbi:MAG TPA: two-component regulator propeller domain-containing protein [Puia sp.]|nr:two-component regulator propeller domain-containing protein [Puia sp.]
MRICLLSLGKPSGGPFSDRYSWLFLFLFFVAPRDLCGQKYSFFKYNVEEGLVQSQANAFCQDAAHHLWIATVGGISRFDGRQFRNFSQADGLLYNFSTSVINDRRKGIWVGTTSGLCYFNGNRFTNYPFPGRSGTNFIRMVVQDTQGVLWALAGRGLYRINVGANPGAGPFPDPVPSPDARTTPDMRASGNQVFSPVFADGDSVSIYSTISLDRSGRPWVAIYKKGIYALENGSWVPKIGLSGNPLVISKILFDDAVEGRIWLLHARGMLEALHGKVHPVQDAALKGLEGDLITAAQGPFSDLWISSTKGLYRWADHALTRFSTANGFTESPVGDIFRDRENNVWFATNGSGIFRYSYEDFSFLDRSQGLTGTLITGIAEDGQHRIVMGVYGDGLYRYEGGRLARISVPAGVTIKKITSIYPSRGGGLLIGTENEGIWEYGPGAGRAGVGDGAGGTGGAGRPGRTDVAAGAERFSRMDRPGTGLPAFINAAAEDSSQTGDSDKAGDSNKTGDNTRRGRSVNYWFATPFGLFHYHDGHAQIIRLTNFTNCVFVAGKDSVLAGTPEGLFLIGKGGAPELVKPLGNSPVMCMTRRDNIIFIGTEDKGIVAWDLTRNSMSGYRAADGLSSDFIYSLLVDGQGDVWAGTGRGINKLAFGGSGGAGGSRAGGGAGTAAGKVGAASGTLAEKARIISYAVKGSMTASECSENVSFMRRDRSIWWGTNNGAVIYTPSTVARQSFPSHIVLQKVRLFSKEMGPVAPGSPVSYADSLTEGYAIPPGLRLAHDSNHLSFEFRGISLANPDAVYYEYMLEGADKRFSDLTPDPFVVYPGLPPGKYRFLVRSYTADAGYSDNEAAFPFEIIAPFYKTKLFDLLLIMLLIGLTLWIQSYRIRSKVRRQRQIEKLKQEEQLIIRQRTSEDFHDELGNKLTRISVLTDILQNKLSGTPALAAASPPAAGSSGPASSTAAPAHAAALPGDARPAASSTSADTARILTQIKENVAALYTGTKDILWSLNPESDSVDGISTRLQDFGIELFQETAIQFQFVTETPGTMSTRLPSDYSRNITMIFKEAMNNVLKHSGCRNVIFRIRSDGQHAMIFSLEDDGKGFVAQDPSGSPSVRHLQQNKKGYGVNNMHMRSSRIHAGLKIVSAAGSREGESKAIAAPGRGQPAGIVAPSGTRIELTIKIG